MATMKIHYFHLLLVGNIFFFNVGQSADGVPKFRIELIDYISSAMNPTYAFAEGLQLPQNLEKLEELRIAAKDYVSASWKKPEGPTPLRGRTMGRILYPKNLVPSSWTTVIELDTVPEMYLHAAKEENEFVIMIVYDTIEINEEYVFNVDITTINPLLVSKGRRDEEPEDRPPRSSIFENYSFLKFLHICVKALGHVQHLVSEVKVDSINLKTATIESTKVGHNLSELNLYNFNEGQLEEHIALECPITPSLYIYPKPSSTDFQILIVAKINK